MLTNCPFTSEDESMPVSTRLMSLNMLLFLCVEPETVAAFVVLSLAAAAVPALSCPR